MKKGIAFYLRTLAGGVCCLLTPFLGGCYDDGALRDSIDDFEERGGLAIERAGLGSSVYFSCRTAGAFIGSILLVRMDDLRYFRIHTLMALGALAALCFAESTPGMLALVGLVGFFCSSLFSVIYSVALKRCPEKANEVSGLMITGVCGGAVAPPLMGLCADWTGSQLGSVLVIGACMIYLAVCAFALRDSVGS